MNDYILAIDQGTSQTKALIMDRGGRVLASNAAPVHTNIIGETRIEQDSLDILRSVELACDLLVLATPLLAWIPPALAGAAALPGVLVAGSAARGEIDAGEAVAAGTAVGRQAAAWVVQDKETSRQRAGR